MKQGTRRMTLDQARTLAVMQALAWMDVYLDGGVQTGLHGRWARLEQIPPTGLEVRVLYGDVNGDGQREREISYKVFDMHGLSGGR